MQAVVNVPTISADGVIVEDYPRLKSVIATLQSDGVLASEIAQRLLDRAESEMKSTGKVDVRALAQSITEEGNETTGSSRFLVLFGAGFVAGVIVGAYIYAETH